MYAYDFVNLIAAALLKAGWTEPAKVTAALNEVTTEGANGDQRAFNRHQPRRRRGRRHLLRAVSRHDPTSRWKDDPLSATLPDVAADAMKRWCSRCSAGLVIPASAHAARVRTTSHFPRRSRRSRRPLRSSGGATSAAEGVRHRIAAKTTVDLSLDRRLALRGERHPAARRPRARGLLLHDRRAGARRRGCSGLRSTPGLRSASILWAGFNPGRRVDRPRHARWRGGPFAAPPCRGHPGARHARQHDGRHDRLLHRRCTCVAARAVPRAAQEGQVARGQTDERRRATYVEAHLDRASHLGSVAYDGDDRPRRVNVLVEGDA